MLTCAPSARHKLCSSIDGPSLATGRDWGKVFPFCWESWHCNIFLHPKLGGNSGYFAKSGVPRCFLLVSWNLCRMMPQVKHSHQTVVMCAPDWSVYHFAYYSFLLYLNSPLIVFQRWIQNGQKSRFHWITVSWRKLLFWNSSSSQKYPLTPCSAGSHRTLILCFGAWKILLVKNLLPTYILLSAHVREWLPISPFPCRSDRRCYTTKASLFLQKSTPVQYEVL